MISKITTQNFKGSNLDQPLKKMNMIVGENFRGKTTIIDAIRVAMLGYHPDLGKRNNDTFRLSSGLNMSTSMQIGDVQVTRLFAQKGSSVKGETVGSLPEGMDKTLSIMLNPSEYFNLTEGQRINYVFSLIDGGGSKAFRKSIVSSINAIAKDDDMEEVCEDMISAVDGFYEKHEDDICAFIDALCDDFAERGREIKRDIKRYKESIKEFSDLIAKNAENAPDTASDLDKRIKEMRESRDALTKKGAALKKVSEQAASLRDRRNKLQAVIERFPFVDESYAEEIKELQRERKKEIESGEEIDVLLQAVRRSASELKGKISAVEKSVAEQTHDINEVKEHTHCPYCLASEKGWQDRVLKKLGDQLSSDKKRFAAMSKEFASEESKVKTHQEALQESKRRVSALTSKIDELTAREQKIREGNSKHKSAKEELENMKIEDVEPEELEKIDEEHSSLTDHLLLLEKEQRVSFEIESLRKNLADSESKLSVVERELSATDSIHKLAKEEKAKIVADAFRKILEPANRLTNGILKSELVYNDGEIGYWNKGQWVSFKTFSGTEQALAYAAVGMGVATLSPFKFVIIDELGRLDSANLKKVLQRVLECIEEGVIDQFIGISTSETKDMKSLQKEHEDVFSVISVG